MHSLNRILVATDYSPLGHAAVGRAAQIAKLQGAELRIIHVAPDWNLFSRSFEGRQAHYSSISQYAQSALRSEIQWVQETFALRAAGDVNVGNATTAILRVASEFQPDLLVVGARGEHAQTLGPSALGGTALKLLATVQQAILFVRDAKIDPYSEVLVAIKGEADLARRILDWKSTVAPSSICHLVRAYDVPYIERLRLCGVTDAALEQCAQDTRQSAQRETTLALQSNDEAAQIKIHLVSGDPLKAVLTEIVRDRVQLLMVGKQARSAEEAAHRLLGSVAVRLAYHAGTDVLMVP